MLDKHLGHPFRQEWGHPFSWEPDCKSCHVSTSYKVTYTSSSGKAFTSSSGKLKIFNVGQPFGASISLGIWGIHLAENQIVRYVMFLHHARLPLPVVQEKRKTVNVEQTFGASISLGIGHPFGWEPDCKRCYVSYNMQFHKGGIHLHGTRL